MEEYIKAYKVTRAKKHWRTKSYRNAPQVQELDGRESAHTQVQGPPHRPLRNLVRSHLL